MLSCCSSLIIFYLRFARNSAYLLLNGNRLYLIYLHINIFSFTNLLCFFMKNCIKFYYMSYSELLNLQSSPSNLNNFISHFIYNTYILNIICFPPCKSWNFNLLFEHFYCCWDVINVLRFLWQFCVAHAVADIAWFASLRSDVRDWVSRQVQSTCAVLLLETGGD